MLHAEDRVGQKPCRLSDVTGQLSAVIRTYPLRGQPEGCVQAKKTCESGLRQLSWGPSWIGPSYASTSTGVPIMASFPNVEVLVVRQSLNLQTSRASPAMDSRPKIG